jgi:HlyD family secretion protein
MKRAIKRAMKRAMNRYALLPALARMVVIIGCSKNGEPTYQGWIEANLVFVSPDEAGRPFVVSFKGGRLVGE